MADLGHDMRIGLACCGCRRYFIRATGFAVLCRKCYKWQWEMIASGFLRKRDKLQMSTIRYAKRGEPNGPG